jgi:tRNA G18 (ribose-2'-O)-methylase SpoU
MRKLSMTELGRLSASDHKTATKYPLVVVLDNVRSMHNVGSVFRSADAFAVEKILLCGFTPQPPHRDIHKTALGATETVLWQYHPQTLEAVQLLVSQGYTAVAVEQTNQSTLLQQFQWNGQQPLALIFGNEVTGVSDEVLALCAQAIEIPQWGTKHSINISVAAGIVMYALAAAAGK